MLRFALNVFPCVHVWLIFNETKKKKQIKRMAFFTLFSLRPVLCMWWEKIHSFIEYMWQCRLPIHTFSILAMYLCRRILQPDNIFVWNQWARRLLNRCLNCTHSAFRLHFFYTILNSIRLFLLYFFVLWPSILIFRSRSNNNTLYINI